MEISVPTITCKRCNYTWVPRKADVRLCPKCRSARFDQAREPEKCFLCGQQSDDMKQVIGNAQVYNLCPECREKKENDNGL